MLKNSFIALIVTVWMIGPATAQHICYQTGVNRHPLGAPQIEALKDLLYFSNQKQAQITSTWRTPRRQAEIMIQIILAQGKKAALALYTTGVSKKVILEYFRVQNHNQSAPPDQTLSAVDEMTSIILDYVTQNPEHTKMNHVRPSAYITVDFSLRGIQPSRVAAAARKMWKDFDHVLAPPVDRNAVHLPMLKNIRTFAGRYEGDCQSIKFGDQHLEIEVIRNPTGGYYFLTMLGEKVTVLLESNRRHGQFSSAIYGDFNFLSGNDFEWLKATSTGTFCILNNKTLTSAPTPKLPICNSSPVDAEFAE